MDHRWRSVGELYHFCSVEVSWDKKKKIPPPSETRWLFFRDALRALLDQTELVDAFLNEGNNHEKCETHIATSKHPLGRIKDVQFSFGNQLVFAHFKFGLFLFDVLGDINEILQAKYSFVNYFWGHVENLRSFLVRELMKLENNDLSCFDYR